MTPRSAKSKGRTAQNKVRDILRVKFPKLEPEDIESRQMGGTGTDIILSPAAQKLIPFDIEVKNQEKLNVWSALEQAETNTKKGRIPLLIFKRNRTKMYACIEFEKLMELI